MRNIWKKYSYVIVLLTLSYLFAFILINQPEQHVSEQYIHVVVKEGDTLWGVAEKYASQYNMSREEFIDWIESTNGIMRSKLVAGTSIAIPIDIQETYRQTVASSE